MSFTPLGQSGSSRLGDTSAGQELGRYSLLFRFAAGGMAEVFAGRMRGEGGFEKPVAIKRMLPALAEEPKFVDMFLDEARIAAMVSSPHVVPTLDVGKDEEGLPYIVMELVIGLSLSQLMRALLERQQPFPPLPMIVEVLAQAAQGLDDAHNARRPTGEPLELVHRDVSPQNILVGIDGRARLTDFGVARAIQRVTRTNTGEVKGKLSYFSPEQAKNAALDQRSDVFALGIVAWEVVTGRRLFQRDDPMSTLKAVLQEPIPLVTAIRPDVPAALASTIALALVRDREQRFESAGAFAHALRTSGVTAPTRSALGKWIESLGGEKLHTFQGRIATAFGAAPAPRESGVALQPATPDPPVEVRVEPPSNSAVRTVLRQPQPAVVSEAPTQPPLTPPFVAPQSASSSGAVAAVVAPPSGPSPVVWIAVGVVVALVVAGAIGLALGGGRDTPEVVASPLAPVPTTTPAFVPAPGVVTPTSPPVVVDVAPAGPVVAPAGPARPVASGTRHASAPTLAPTPAPSEVAVPVTEIPRPVVAPEPPLPVHVAEPEAHTTETPRETMPRETTPRETTPRETTPAPSDPPASTTSGRRRLLGLDQFQRETSGTP